MFSFVFIIYCPALSIYQALLISYAMSRESEVGFRRPHTPHELAVIRKVQQEEREYHDLLRREFNTQFNEDFAGLAFNVGLTPEEMRTHIGKDPGRFKNVYLIAINEVMEYGQAERIYQEGIIRGEILLDKIGRAYSRKRRYYPKPEKMYQQDKSRRKAKTKGQVIARAQGYINWKKAHDALNVERGTPLDEFPDIFPPGE